MTTLNENHTAKVASAPPEQNTQAILAQLVADAPPAVTFVAIEAAICAAGFDPIEAQDLYLDILDGLDRLGVPAVDQLVPTESSAIEDEAVDLADETIAQLRKLRRDTSHFNHTLLTAANERRLLEIYHDGRRARAELHVESSAKQRLAIERRVAAGNEALDELVGHNMRLVASFAYKVATQTSHLDAEDLLQEGLMGLQRAIELYRLDLGYRLSTYATFWIRQAINRAVADQDRMVRLPVHIIESLSALRRTTRQLVTTLGREPTAEELAAASNLPLKRVRQLQLLSRQHLSLDLPVGTEGDACLGDILPDTRMLEPERALVERSRHEAIHRLIESDAGLTSMERRIIQLRFGLTDGDRRTLQEIGDQFKVTRERIRQIEVRALRKLKTDARREQLKTYLED